MKSTLLILIAIVAASISSSNAQAKSTHHLKVVVISFSDDDASGKNRSPSSVETPEELAAQARVAQRTASVDQAMNNLE